MRLTQKFDERPGRGGKDALSRSLQTDAGIDPEVIGAALGIGNKRFPITRISPHGAEAILPPCGIFASIR